MANKITSLSMYIVFSFVLNHADAERLSYIVHMDKSSKPSPFDTHHTWYTSLISSLSQGDSLAASHLYTYNHVMDGFSAVLSPAQLEKLESMPGHLASYPETYGQLQTTHSPQFLGLNRNTGLWPASHFGDDMIIGIIDTGVWPESEMFNDKGMPPVPKRWRGTCESGGQFNSSNCNRKLIGARSFSKGINVSKVDDYDSARDFYGHGTHTASTAAGSPAPGADYFGYAKGTAVGVAPMARIAVYKALFLNSTLKAASNDVLAAMDQAIADGVDLMSLSLGFPQVPYHKDSIALGAFAAMEKGIFVSCAAGNSGPDSYSIYNGVPWITTVGGGTIDRDYRALIKLGDGATTMQGKSIYPGDIHVSGVPLYYGHGNARKRNCTELDTKEVAGKIVFCCGVLLALGLRSGWSRDLLLPHAALLRIGLSSLQKAIVDHNGTQCGYCTPGMVLAALGAVVVDDGFLQRRQPNSQATKAFDGGDVHAIHRTERHEARADL
ncbi:hypothetical protein ACLOJK_041291 [Asimina triloba]